MKKYLLRILMLCMMLLSLYTIASAQKPDSTTAENALNAYLNNEDLSYGWQVVDAHKSQNITSYNLLLTSQIWHGITWKHQLTVIVPERIEAGDVLLFITGGNNLKENPEWKNTASDNTTLRLADIARNNKAITAVISQIPNQPLFGDLKEDELISYTLHQFKTNHDYTWPLLFPMTKSTVKAMDAVTEFIAEQFKRTVSGFVVAGASKRGWTTWLTAANDQRVIGAAPMVFDVLNMPKSLKYQIETFGGYSQQIHEYEELGILGEMHSDTGSEIVQMIDPYCYRKNCFMPKVLFMGTNDPYWATDNVKNYFDSIPGHNRILYTPNAGHNLGDAKDAFQTLEAFFNATLDNNLLPLCEWKTTIENKNLLLKIKTSKPQLCGAELWTAEAPSRDFRNASWEAAEITLSNGEYLSVNVPLPQKGYGACYVALLYKTTNGKPFKISTRIFTYSSGRLL